MRPNTITTLCKLKQGDLFTKADGETVYQKIDKPIIKKGKHTYTCFACRVDRLVPVPMPPTLEVIFLKKIKETA